MKGSVFLLSMEEVRTRFVDGESWKCVPTDYAIMCKNAYKDKDYGTCVWWVNTTRLNPIMVLVFLQSVLLTGILRMLMIILLQCVLLCG